MEADGSQGEFFALAQALAAFKAGPLSGTPSDQALGKVAQASATTIGNWLRGARFPQDLGRVLIVVRKVEAVAAARGVTPPPGLLDEDHWRAAYREEAQRRAGVVSGAVQRAQAASVLATGWARVRVSDAALQWLGVHEAISVPGVAGGVMPEYVPRDIDTAKAGVWGHLAAAGEQGGFVLLVGGSSVGKTRTAAEAVKALLPGWQLVHPAGPDQVAALAAAPPAQTVVWLDELQRYLGGEHGLTGGVMRTLLAAPHPVVIVGTLWSDLYTAWTAVRAVGGADIYAREREVLDLASVVSVAPVFSPAEQERARDGAERDPQLRAALTARGYGLTQTLAAAPQLVSIWRDAQTANPYGWAVLTAALEVARLGARAPLRRDLLRAAAVDYCTSAQQAEAPADWFEQALAYATHKLHGAAVALSPAAAAMGQIAGYAAADYLIQHADRERRHMRVPASTWNAIADHISDPADAARLADSARKRLLYRYAIPLYRQAAAAGDSIAAGQLAELLEERGDLDGAEQVLRAHADASDESTARRLAEFLARQGDLAKLRARADTGDEWAIGQLVELLEKRGDLDGVEQVLRARADAGDELVAGRLAELLEERGDLDGAEQVLRVLADGGDVLAAGRLADLLEERGDLDGAEQVLRAWADADATSVGWQLIELLEKRGDLDGAEQVLRAWADAAYPYAAGRLAELLAQRGDLAGLRARADAGDRWATGRLAVMLAQRGEFEALRAWADTGDGLAARRLAEVLEVRGALDAAEQVLRALADTGNEFNARQLANVVMKQGRGEEAERLRKFGLNPDGSIASA